MENKREKLIVGMTGATGAIFGVRILQALQGSAIETHLVMSKWASRTLIHETPFAIEEVKQMATHNYASNDLGATISSGSFLTAGMVVAPCSMRTLGAIAQGVGDNLIHRAADVVLKERRRLVLVVRETPFSDIHLENMLKLSRMGAVIMPPVPALYNNPRTIDDIINHIVMRILDQFGIQTDVASRWDGIMTTGQKIEEKI